MPVYGTPIGDVWPEPESGMSDEWAWISELITEEGRSMTLKKAEGYADEDKPWEGNNTFSTLTVTGVVCKYKRKEVDGSLILKADKKVYIAPLAAIAIEEYDLLVDTNGDGKTYKIVKPEKIMPGTENLLYKLQVRR